MVSVTAAARQTGQSAPAEALYDYVVRKNWAAVGAAAEQY